MEIAEIVHDIDLKDNKFNRLGAAGLNAAVRGLSGLLKDDRKLLQAVRGNLRWAIYVVKRRSRSGQRER